MAVILLKVVPCSFPPVSLVVVVQSLSCVRLFLTPWMVGSSPVSSVLYYLPEFAQMHIH